MKRKDFMISEHCTSYTYNTYEFPIYCVDKERKPTRVEKLFSNVIWLNTHYVGKTKEEAEEIIKKIIKGELPLIKEKKTQWQT